MNEYKFYINDIEITEPTNWDDIKLGYIRSDVYFGLLTSASIDTIELYSDAYDYVMAQFDETGFQTEATFRIDKLCGDTLSYYTLQEHSIIFNDIQEDFTSESGNIVKIKVVDSSAIYKLNSRDDTELVIGNIETIEGFATTIPYRDKVDVTYKSRGLLKEFKLNDAPFEFDYSNYQVDYYSISTAYAQRRGTTIPLTSNFDAFNFSNNPALVTFSYQNPNTDSGTSPYLWSSMSPFALLLEESAENHTISVDFNVNIIGDAVITNGSTIDLILYEASYDGTVFSGITPVHMTTYTAQSDIFDSNFIMNFNDSYTFTKEYNKVYFYAVRDAVNNTGGVFFRFTDFDVDLNLSYEEYIEDGIHSTTLIYEALANSLEQITDTTEILYSETFGRIDLGYSEDGAYHNIGMINGYQLRNAVNSDDTDVSLVCKFKDLYGTLDSIIGLKMFYSDGKIHIEKRDFDTNNATEITLDQITNSFNKDLLLTDVVVGNTQIAYEDVNGTNEFNNLHNYALPMNLSTNKLELKTSMQTDYLAVELARTLSFANSGDEDTKYDEKNFLVELIKDNGVWRTKMGYDYALVSGIPLPQTAGNIGFSPKRMLINNSDLISASFFKNQNLELNFSSCSNLAALESSELGLNVIVERSNLVMEQMKFNFKPRLWKGYNTTLTTIEDKLYTFLVGCKRISGYIWSAELSEGLWELEILERLVADEIELFHYIVEKYELYRYYNPFHIGSVTTTENVRLYHTGTGEFRAFLLDLDEQSSMDAIITWANGNDVRVNRIYNQGIDSGFDLIQGSVGSMPYLDMTNWLIDFSQGSHFLETSYSTPITDSDSLMICSYQNGNDVQTLLAGVTEEVAANTNNRVVIYDDRRVGSYVMGNYIPDVSNHLLFYPTPQSDGEDKVVTLVHENTTIYGYSNGVLIDSVTTTDVFNDNTKIVIGKQNAGPRFFNGKFKGLCLHNNTLSASVINEIEENLSI